MDLPNEIPALRTAIMVFSIAHGAGLAAYTREHLETAAGFTSPVDQFTMAAEALYAGIDDVDPASADAACTLTGQLANFVGTMWGTMSVDGRGLAIYAAMRRRLGETEGPDPSEDPAPLPEYAAPE